MAENVNPAASSLATVKSLPLVPQLGSRSGVLQDVNAGRPPPLSIEEYFSRPKSAKTFLKKQPTSAPQMFQTIQPTSAPQTVQTKQPISTPLTSQKKPVSAKSDFPCGVCGLTYATRQGLSRHWNTHHAGVRYICNICNTSMKRKDYLKRHIEVEHEVADYMQFVTTVGGAADEATVTPEGTVTAKDAQLSKRELKIRENEVKLSTRAHQLAEGEKLMKEEKKAVEKEWRKLESSKKRQAVAEATHQQTALLQRQLDGYNSREFKPAVPAAYFPSVKDFGTQTEETRRVRLAPSKSDSSSQTDPSIALNQPQVRQRNKGVQAAVCVEHHEVQTSVMVEHAVSHKEVQTVVYVEKILSCTATQTSPDLPAMVIAVPSHQSPSILEQDLALSPETDDDEIPYIVISDSSEDEEEDYKPPSKKAKYISYMSPEVLVLDYHEDGLDYDGEWLQ